jgi:hypothetical protein
MLRLSLVLVPCCLYPLYFSVIGRLCLEIIKWVFAISGANTVKNKPKPVVNWPLGYLKTRKLQYLDKGPFIFFRFHLDSKNSSKSPATDPTSKKTNKKTYSLGVDYEETFSSDDKHTVYQFFLCVSNVYRGSVLGHNP